MGKPIIKSFNFIRTLCMLGIIAYHFSCQLMNTEFKPLLNFQNGEWGSAFVTTFFVLSGAVLYYQYENASWSLDKLRVYFYKRWKAIFPMYYMAYLYFEIQNILAYKSLFFRGSPFGYIYTLLGMDGYLANTTTTYYIMGEWFTGAIIILYTLFPLICWCFTKNAKITFFLSVLIYVLFLNKPIINPVAFWSVTSCLISFVCGMVFMKYRDFLGKKLCALCYIIGILILCFFKMPIPIDISQHLMGILLFGALNFIGNRIIKLHVFDVLFTELSSISYAAFLMHHITVADVLNAWNPTSTFKILVLLSGVILLVLCQSKVLTLVADAFIKKMDSVFLKTK